MGNIDLINVSKKFGDNLALNNINLHVEDKEFLVIFGPAGAGKTTLLKIIAGVEYVDNGLVKINGEVCNYEEPDKRNIAMVFENYALYPHLTVFDNIASPLRSPMHKQDKTTIEQMVTEIAKKLKIEKLLNKLPQHISNGQKQRTALGRALVRNPVVFLMDEPLAHLDAKLKSFMRTELKEMQSDLDTTTIYVTHDYCEALSLGNRIAILDKGKIVQVGTGHEIYNTPSNKFVARLVGEPEINILHANIQYEIDEVYLNVFEHYKFCINDKKFLYEMKSKNYEIIDIGLRSSDISVSPQSQNINDIKGSVYSVEPIGNRILLIIKIGDDLLRIATSYENSYKVDSEIYLRLNFAHALFFDPVTELLVYQNNILI